MTSGEKNRRTRERNRAYRTRRALRIFRKGQPKTREEAWGLGLTLVEVGQGAFRTAYRIYGTNLLVKFPLQCKYQEVGEDAYWHDKEGKNHTRMEVKKIRQLRKFPVMAKHLPPIYYYNCRDGVLVTKYYDKSRWLESRKNDFISKIIKAYCGIVLGDLSPDNLRTSFDHLIFIDLGY